MFRWNGIDTLIGVENNVIQTIGVAHGSAFLQIYMIFIIVAIYIDLGFYGRYLFEVHRFCMSPHPTKASAHHGVVTQRGLHLEEVAAV